MKKYLLFFLFVVSIHFSKAQLLSTSPVFPVDGNGVPLVITVDGTKGNKALQGFTGNVYVHIGIITTANPVPGQWASVQTVWGSTDANALCTSAGTDKWSFTINNIRTFFGLDATPGTRILKIGILFRSGGCSSNCTVQRNIDGSDMYISVLQPGAFDAKITAPPAQPTFIPTTEPVTYIQGSTIPVSATSSINANLTLRLNGTQLVSGNGVTVINSTLNTSCQQQLTLEAVNGATTIRDTVNFFIYPATYPTGAKPAGRKDGITYENNNTEAVLILYAPQKNRVSAVGDFSNFNQTCSNLMTKDGDYFWLRLTGLTPGTQYRYQYIVDDTFRITDPYSELVLDPQKDNSISTTTFPNRPAYPSSKASGIVGVLTPGETTYNWTSNSYVRPDKKDLIVYELLMRDFTAAENWQTLKDTLNYIKGLGFNAIELMPFNEFEDNDSWGYNPTYFFAPDKAYGTKNALKSFIDAAHNLGIAVIQDVAFNHATGVSPLAVMWWNSSLSQPAANSPYFYQTAQHPFNVFNDFNHNSEATKAHVARFIRHWLTEYRIDGFRWDLSKGFTTQDYGTCDNPCIGNWNAYNQGRINIWQRYYDSMQVVSPGSYCILEHLGNNDEEAELARRGMLLWGKMTFNFAGAVKGVNSEANLDGAYWRNRSFWNATDMADKPHLITYAESHDEERIIYSSQNDLNTNTSNSSHNPKDLNIALKRDEAMAAVLMGIPGPKMIWQFGELGYDVSINFNGRTGRKPIRWEYYQQVNRRRVYETFSAMAKLRQQKPNAFRTSTLATGSNLGSSLTKSIVVDHPDLKYVVVANFDVNGQAPTVSFPATGTWYNYTQGGSITVAGTSQAISIPAGEYRVFLNQNIGGGIVTNVRDIIASNSDFKLSVYPNPVQTVSTIQYELPKSGYVSIQVINVQGQVVATKNMGFQLKGLQLYELNKQNFSGTVLIAGQYILQVRVDNVVRYEKIMVQQ
jgi:1,4-alpha-glucan branching enzyme